MLLIAIFVGLHAALNAVNHSPLYSDTDGHWSQRLYDGDLMAQSTASNALPAEPSYLIRDLDGPGQHGQLEIEKCCGNGDPYYLMASATVRNHTNAVVFTTQTEAWGDDVQFLSDCLALQFVDGKGDGRMELICATRYENTNEMPDEAGAEATYRLSVLSLQNGHPTIVDEQKFSRWQKLRLNFFKARVSAAVHDQIWLYIPGLLVLFSGVGAIYGVIFGLQKGIGYLVRVLGWNKSGLPPPLPHNLKP